MAVAALYDVHGNLAALDAVLAEVPPDATIVVGGDFAAGPFPRETVDRLRSLGDRALFLRGNAERELVPGEEGRAPADVLEWVRARLDPATIEWFEALPPSLVHDGVFYCHATARNDEDIFTELTPEERVAPHFAAVEQPVVVCGHTHMQFDRVVVGRRIVNAGSVGMSYDEPPGAYWLLDLEPRFTPYALDIGAYPFEWPSAPRAEALAYFESLAA